MLGRRGAVEERINTRPVERILTFNGGLSAAEEFFENIDKEEKLLKTI